MTQAVLKLALEALQADELDMVDDGSGNMVFRKEQAITAMEKLLAQPEQEPVAWMSPSWIDPDTRGWQDDSFESIPIEGWLPIYTQPPQRTWVGLTDEEKHYIRYSHMTSAEFIEFIEAKLKEKNNG